LPTVQSLHSDKRKNSSLVDLDKLNSEINILISDITYEILRDSPTLVTEVNNGTISEQVLEKSIIQIIDKNKYYIGKDRQKVIEKVFDFMFKYGPLQSYVEDDSISDIDGTRYDNFTIKRYGKRERIAVNFGNEKIFENYCKIIALRNGGILNENDTHCRISDEKNRLRVNLSIPPRNLSGPAISIRKHPKENYTFEKLISLGMMNENVANYLKDLSRSNKSILICGKGGSGKTTLLRAIVDYADEMERILIAESDSEIYPKKPNCIVQRVKKKNEGGIPVTLLDLIIDGLTMSLDTYVVGELTDGVAWYFIIAGFTGHRVMATTHTWSAEGALPRMLTLAKMAQISESEKTIKEMIATSIDIVIHMDDFKVDEIIEVLSYDPYTDNYRINRLYKYNKAMSNYECYKSCFVEKIK